MKTILAGLAVMCLSATAFAGHSSFGVGVGFSNGYNSIGIGYAQGGHGGGGYSHGGYSHGGYGHGDYDHHGYGHGYGSAFSFGFQSYCPPPVYYAPAPVVYAAPPVVYAPAPVVYAPAPPVVYAPAPVVYAPAPVVVAPAPCYPQYYGNSISFGFSYRR